MKPKPSLLLIRHPIQASDVQRQIWYEDGFTPAFRHDFDVTIVEDDCDLNQLCETIRPDLIAFGGSYCAPHRRITVLNPLSNPHIPRVGLYFGDGFCTSRPAFFSDMEQWGVDVYFTQTFYMPEHTPEAAGRSFIIPHIVDEGLFRDYGEPKTIPFIVFGELSEWRRWRRDTAMALLQRYPTMICPHPGYGSAPGRAISYIGEDFARMLNRSQFSICDGSVFNCVLRKHIEIPACGAILISQPIAGLGEYGFVDMQNCIIGEGDELFDKLAALIADPERQKAVAQAGYELAQSRHTARQCDQLKRWFDLRRALRPGESIIQHGTFGAFEIVRDGRQGAISPYTQVVNELEAAVREAEAEYRRGNLSKSFDLVMQALQMRTEFAPARLLLTRILLRSGHKDSAVENATFLFNFALRYYACPEPDPVEWAWWVITHLCHGLVDGAKTVIATYPRLRHVEMRRAQWLLDIVDGAGAAAPAPEPAGQGDRPSVAIMVHAGLQDWADEVTDILRRCGQDRMAERIAAHPALSRR